MDFNTKITSINTSKIKTMIFWSLFLVTIIVAGFLFAPYIKVLHIQTESGKTINHYVELFEKNNTGAIEGNFFCLIPLFNEIPEYNDIPDVTSNLEEAKKLLPENRHTKLLLGQAYCLQKEYQQAIDVFSDHLGSNPNNKLVNAEIGYAFLVSAIHSDDEDQFERLFEKAVYHLNMADIDKGMFNTYGDQALSLGKPQNALNWYKLAEISGTISEQNQFYLAILKLMFSDETEIKQSLPADFVKSIEDSRTFFPPDFFHIKNGNYELVRTVEGFQVAAILSNMNEIGILFEVNKSGKYCINLVALDQKPEPTQIRLSIDFASIMDMELPYGNGKTMGFSKEVKLSSGAHLISIQFLNDYHSPGIIDRNAYIVQLDINYCE